MSAELETELNRLVKVLRDSTNNLERYAREMVDATSDYKIAYAKAYLTAEGPIPEREAKATVTTDELFRRKILAEELYRVQREKIGSVRDAIGAVQTLNANARFLAGKEPF